MRKSVKFLAACIDLALLFICGAVVYYSSSLPDNFYVTDGHELTLSCFFDVSSSPDESALYSSQSEVRTVEKTETLRLFGVIPIKQVTVETVDAPVLVPCGTPFGIKLLSDGVMVVGIGEVQCCDRKASPASDAGIEIGDVLVSLDGEKVRTNSDIVKVISASGGNPVEVELLRGETEMELLLYPEYSVSSDGWQVGMWVRDSTAGIGTMTFYDAQSGCFGGLGHPVCDVDTGNIIPLSAGEVCAVTIDDVVKGCSGSPGELVGSFCALGNTGKLTKNTSCGVFGNLSFCPVAFDSMPMAMRQEVRTGSATILTTVYGESPEEYKIEIEKIDLRENSDGKNMVIKITDERLLSRTGGIVQGMSGSPIIQDGKLVGAVTYVFVNDSSRGYGIFCENMYDTLYE